MYQYLGQDRQARKKVFFKPQISSEMKFTPQISPQFINDTNLLYMSAYDFMGFNTDEECFSYSFRPLPSQQELKKCQQEFINVNFGKSTRQRTNQIFYVIKNSTQEEECFYLCRRINSVNHQYERNLIARNKKVVKKKFNPDDIDNLGNIRMNKKKKSANKQEQVPQGILQFKKQFIVKQSSSLVIFVVKKQVKQQANQPQIKLSEKHIVEASQQQQEEEKQISLSDLQSLPSTKELVKKETVEPKPEKHYKNHLLIHSYQHNQTMTFQVQESIQSAFQILPGSPNLICVTEKFVYLLNFSLKNSYVPNKISSSFDIDEKTSYQDSSRGYLNSDIKVEIMDKFQLEFQIQTQGSLPKNLFNLSNLHDQSSSKQKNKKRNRRNRSVAANSILKDRRVSSVLQQAQRNSQKIQKNLQTNDTKNASQSSFKKQKGLQKSKFSNFATNQNKSQQCQSLKIIKKALRVLPLSFIKQEFILIVYVKSKVLCTGDAIETLSFQYESKLFSVQQTEMFEISFEQRINQINRDPFTANINDFEEVVPLVQQENKEANIFRFINELGDITVNNGVILIWEKFQPVIHEIVFRVDFHTQQMVDLSDPKNLKSQKTIFSSVEHILEYQNKITLHLDSDLIRQIVISPNSQNFLILSGRNHLNNQYSDSQFENLDARPEDLQQKYDIQNYYIFQYDLFSQLWSSDASVYLKNIPLCYQKRKVEEIAPFTLKNQVLALTGKKVHQMHKSLLDGILDFDLHAFGYFIAVSFGFNAKIYSFEHNLLNLIYTYNAQNIKKIKYSPNGSELVIMSQKAIKILDSYSFSVKYVIQQKSSTCSFNTFAFSFSGFQFCTVYDNAFVNIYDGHSYSKINYIKPGLSSMLGVHDRIISIVYDTKERFFLALLENGKLYLKFNEQVVVIQHERIYEYTDGKIINCVHYDSKRGVLFCGLQNGIVRAHIWPIKNESSYTFDNYSQFKFGYALITVIKSSVKSCTVFVGDSNGNLTTSKFIVEKEKKVTGQLRPNNFYIYASNSPMMNMPRSQLQTAEKTEKYILGSNSIAQDGEKMKLEYKLNEIITKMNDQMKRFKRQMKEKLIEKQGMAKCKINFNKLYNSEKDKLKEVAQELKQLKDKQAYELTALTEKYELQLKKVIFEQNELVKQKGLELSKNVMAKVFLKYMHSNELDSLRQRQKKMENQFTTDGLKNIELIIREEELVPFDEMEYVPQGFADVKQELVMKLQEELQKQQERNYQLKQECTYMQNAINNLQLTAIKEQTLQFRVNLELQQMQGKLQQQSVIHKNLKEQLKQAETKINNTQANIVHRNPQFSRNIEGSSANDDACTYKLWVKDKMVQQVQLLFDHYNDLNEIMEQKQQDIIEVVTFKKKIQDSFNSLTLKKQNMKAYIKELKDHLLTVNNHLSHLKFQSSRYEELRQIDMQKSHRNQQLEELRKNEVKQNNFLESKPMKIVLKNILQHHPSEKSQKKYKTTTSQRSSSKNKTLVVNDKNQTHQIIVKNLNSRNSKKNSFCLQTFRESKNNSSKSEEMTKYIKQKTDKIIEEVQEKIKKQIKTLQNQKTNTQGTYRSSSQQSLTKQLKKLSNQKLFTQNQQNFSVRLLQRLKQKEQQDEKQQLKIKNKQGDKTYVGLSRIIPFSATSSPKIKKIASNFNIFQKSNKYLKNNLKIQQRKVKRLQGQKGELLSEYEQLRFENKQLSDKQALIHQGIQYLNQLRMQQTANGLFKNEDQHQVKIQFKTPFQKYVEQKNSKSSLNKTLGNFKEIFQQRPRKLFSSRSSRHNFGLKTAMNSPRNVSPIKLSQSLSFLKRK